MRPLREAVPWNTCVGQAKCRIKVQNLPNMINWSTGAYEDINFHPHCQVKNDLAYGLPCRLQSISFYLSLSLCLC